MIAFVFFLFANCSDDKDKDNIAMYQGTYLGNNLELTINGIQTTGKVLGINNKRELILQYIVPGESVIDIPLTEKNGWLEGSYSLSNGSVLAKGILKDKKLIMDLTIQVPNALIGEWDLVPFKENENQEVISSPIFVNATPPDASVNFLDKTMTVAIFDNLLESILGKYAQAIKSISFKENGYVDFIFTDKIGRASCRERVLRLV